MLGKISFSECSDKEKKFVHIVEDELGTSLCTLNHMVLHGYSQGDKVCRGVQIEPSEVLRTTNKIRSLCDKLDDLVRSM